MQSNKRTRFALFGAGACFLVVDVLLAASIGVADWFSSAQVVRFNPGVLGSTGYFGTQTTLTEVRTGVNGRVIQDYTILLDVKASSGRSVGSFSCVLHVDWNYWAQSKKGDCTTNLDKVLPEDMKSYGQRVCNELVCPFMNQVVLSNVAPNPTCGQLERQRDQAGVSNSLAAWEEKAICSGAKGVLAVLTLALVSATVGFGMCFCCWRAPKRMIVPGLLCCLLSAIAVIVYGAAISSDYPYEAAIVNDLQVSDSQDVANASSGVSTVQIGFGLAIAAAVLSLVSCWLASIAGVIGSADGTELQIVSAVPIQIYQPGGEHNQAQGAQHVVHASTVHGEPVIATSSVIVDAPMPGGSEATPHLEARVVHTESGRGNGGHQPSFNGSFNQPSSNGGFGRSNSGLAAAVQLQGDGESHTGGERGFPMASAVAIPVQETPHDNPTPSETPRFDI